MSLSQDTVLGFLGAGNMGEAIFRGLLDGGVLTPAQIVATDASAERRADIAARFPIRVVDSNEELVEQATVVIFAVKPQVMPVVLEEVASYFSQNKLSISICAGIPCSTIERALMRDTHEEPRVVRVMPNTPALIGAGMSGVCRGRYARQHELELAMSFFEAVGEAEEVYEAQMDAVTALTGSGPAYVFRFIEGLIEAGKKHGFPPDQATRMVVQMVYGAARLAMESDKSPEELRIAVTSPGGTTAAGLQALNAADFMDALQECVDAAEARGKELGGG